MRVQAIFNRCAAAREGENTEVGTRFLCLLCNFYPLTNTTPGTTKNARYVTFIPSLIQHRERQKMLAFAGINQKNIKQEAASSHTGNGFYLSSFISSSMALSIAGRYFSGQSCTLYFTRWYCSVSCFRSSGLKYFSAGNLHR